MNAIMTNLKSTRIEAINSRILLAGILFVCTIASGILLSHSGRPLSSLLINLHKLIALAAVVLVAISIVQFFKMADTKLFIETLLTVISALLVLVLIATGALLTREEMQLPAIVLTIHKAAPLLALITSALTLYLFSKGNG